MLHVSSSGYYHWLHHSVCLRERKEQGLVEQIQQVYEQSKCRYGSPRIAAELQEQDSNVSRPREARLMQKLRV